MVAETHRSKAPAANTSGAGVSRDWLKRIKAVLNPAGKVFRAVGAFVRGIARSSTSSLTRRILILNLAALFALVGGILYLNQFRAGLIDARVDSLLTQGQIIAAAIAAQAGVDANSITIDPNELLELQAGESASPFDVGEGAADFPINPERVAPLLRRLVSPTRTRARIYDQDGTLLLDSRSLYSHGQILRFDLPAPDETKHWYENWLEWVRLLLRRGDLPAYREIGGANGNEYPEVANALNGAAASIVRISEDGGLIVSVAVPVQRFRAVLGALLLSTESGDIDAIVRAERLAIVRVFLVAASVTILLSVLLAGTIAGPVRRLSDAAERIRRGTKKRVQLPDFGDRKDEIGHLAVSLRDMTTALYNRMEAIERFAADVAHELKNPLTSLRSAAETLPIAPTPDARNRLLGIIAHDIRRLDRLISDISDASRLDAEMAREDAEPVDLRALLETVVAVARQTRVGEHQALVLTIDPGRWGRDAFYILGHDIRMGQVVDNLIANALSFSPPDGSVRIHAERRPEQVRITVDDDGCGIRAEALDQIFERFYTDRPNVEDFGQNSGLGLAISRQIVMAHRGTIKAENRTGKDGKVAGARITVILPASR
ncbi:MAG: stimulus-sensing domain-containing protein [Hyphomicrobiales bacterium]|nr:stimulus-sensing domain-containing protein [Hyphomicrobiales bacterium]